ncbi:MAG: hypothetical protein IKD16_03220 [Bacteroidales bacterium]|nr:hypothetical protein [Bacteroidales bacterium]
MRKFISKIPAFLMVFLFSTAILSCTKTNDIEVPEKENPFDDLCVDISPIKLNINLVNTDGMQMLDSSFIANNKITASYKNKTHVLELQTKLIPATFKGLVYMGGKKSICFGELDGLSDINSEPLVLDIAGIKETVIIYNKVTYNNKGIPQIERKFTYKEKVYMDGDITITR